MQDFNVGGGEANGPSELLPFNNDAIKFKVSTETSAGDVYLSVRKCLSDLCTRNSIMVHILPWNFFQFKSISTFVSHQMVKSALSVPAEPMVIANHQIGRASCRERV